MKQNRVLITGYGAVSPFGIGADKMVAGLFAGRSCVVNIKSQLGGKSANGNCFVGAPLAETPDASNIPRKHRRNMGPLAEFAYRAAADALLHAAVPREKIGSAELGVVFSSSLGSAAALEEVFRGLSGRLAASSAPSQQFFQNHEPYLFGQCRPCPGHQRG
jgi:3-oxoacyl-[acyl-carrier-protein] synthase II